MPVGLVIVGDDNGGGALPLFQIRKQRTRRVGILLDEAADGIAVLADRIRL